MYKKKQTIATMTILSILSLTLSLTCITKENYNIEETQKNNQKFQQEYRLPTKEKREKEILYNNIDNEKIDKHIEINKETNNYYNSLKNIDNENVRKIFNNFTAPESFILKTQKENYKEWEITQQQYNQGIQKITNNYIQKNTKTYVNKHIQNIEQQYQYFDIQENGKTYRINMSLQKTFKEKDKNILNYILNQNTKKEIDKKYKEEK